MDGIYYTDGNSLEEELLKLLHNPDNLQYTHGAVAASLVKVKRSVASICGELEGRLSRFKSSNTQ